MDASQITKLLQKQNTRYINRSHTVDSSTMIWRNQIQHSKYIKGVATCTGLQTNDVPTDPPCANGDGTCNYGGGGKQMTLATGSPQQYPSVFAGAAGSGSQVYSSDKILLQQAGRNYCRELISDQCLSQVLPACYESNTNGPTDEDQNPPVNPFLPPFDTYYKFKNLLAPTQDKNQKHYVQRCNGKVIEPAVPPPTSPWPALMVGENPYSWIITNAIVYDGDSVYITGTYVGTVDFYSGGLENARRPVLSLANASTSTNTIIDGFVMKYAKEGAIQWIAPIKMRKPLRDGQPSLAQGCSIAVDANGITVGGQLFNEVYADDEVITTDFYSGYSTGIAGTVYNPEPADNSIAKQMPEDSMFVARYNLSGCVQWVNLISGVFRSYPYSYPGGGREDTQLPPFSTPSMCTNDNYVYITGSTIPDINLVLSPDLTFNINTTQSFLAQYTLSTGELVWAMHMDYDNLISGVRSNGLSIICDNNAVYAAGYFSNNMAYFTKTTPETPGTRIGGISGDATTTDGMYIISYTTAGVFQWINQCSNASSQPSYKLSTMRATRLAQDGTNVYLMTNFRETLSVFFTAGTGGGSPGSAQSMQGINHYDTYDIISIALVRYAKSSGAVSWMSKVTNIGDTNVGRSPSYNYSYGINGMDIVSDGVSVYITGGYLLTISVYDGSTTDPTSGITLAPINTTNGIPITAYLAAYTAATGELRWITRCGQPTGTAVGNGLSTDSDRLLVTGWAVGTVDWYNTNGRIAPTVVGKTLSHSGSLPYSYVVAYDTKGIVIP